MNHAFHQLDMDKESSKLFAFTTPFGLYRFKRLVQSISLASAEYHEILRMVFKNILSIAQIKDDLVVHGKGMQHDHRLEKVFRMARKYNVTFRVEKYKLRQQQAGWFGNLYTA